MPPANALVVAGADLGPGVAGGSDDRFELRR